MPRSRAAFSAGRPNASQPIGCSTAKPAGALVAGDHVAQRVVADMPHVDLAAGIGEHLQHVVFRLAVGRHVVHAEAAALGPGALPRRLGGGEIVARSGFGAALGRGAVDCVSFMAGCIGRGGAAAQVLCRCKRRHHARPARPVPFHRRPHKCHAVEADYPGPNRPIPGSKKARRNAPHELENPDDHPESGSSYGDQPGDDSSGRQRRDRA